MEKSTKTYTAAMVTQKNISGDADLLEQVDEDDRNLDVTKKSLEEAHQAMVGATLALEEGLDKQLELTESELISSVTKYETTWKLCVEQLEPLQTQSSNFEKENVLATDKLGKIEESLKQIQLQLEMLKRKLLTPKMLPKKQEN